MENADSPEVEARNTSGFVEVLAQTSSPVEVGEIEFGQEGVLRQRTSDKPLTFTFFYHGIKWAAAVPHDRDGPIKLTAVLGVIPYSIENAFGRRAAKAIVARAHLPNGRLWIDDTTRVHIELSGTPPRPRTPVSVLSSVTAMLIDAKPYLDLLDVALRRSRRRARRQSTGPAPSGGHPAH